MKKLLIIIILPLFFACRTTKVTNTTVVVSPEPEAKVSADAAATVNFSDPATWILGYFDNSQLRESPYSQWYNPEFSSYTYNEGVIEKLRSAGTEGLSIKIVMGTWCPDSRREVPRFMRIIEGWDFPADRIQFIGVDNAKLSPVGEYESLGILRVPTFIIYRNNIEAGRIIENPLTSLEQDLLNILEKGR